MQSLQPREGEFGNWDMVFKYCASEDFQDAFSYVDFVIIQIDTDILSTDNVPKELQLHIQGLSINEIVDLTKVLLIKKIGEEFYAAFNRQIIFAISVDSIECWFLPIYFGNDKKKSDKTSGCINTLNAVLIQKEGFIINEKRFEYYETIAKHFLKPKDLEKYAVKNQSLSSFLVEFQAKTAL